VGLFGRSGKGNPFDWLVVGLGNPGPKYAGTRHNVGEEAVTLLAGRKGVTLKGGRDNALQAETRYDDQRVVLAFPITFMNDSGQSVGAMVRRYRIESPEFVIVLQDELDLQPGELRVKAGGGLAGHNGLRSTAQHLGTRDFYRLRVGAGRPEKGSVSSHVLGKLTETELRDLPDITAGIEALLSAFVAETAHPSALIGRHWQGPTPR
jgi:PTH1 family peptidyl-tRNA hydrolase